jgi:hypothetical protein
VSEGSLYNKVFTHGKAGKTKLFALWLILAPAGAHAAWTQLTPTGVPGNKDGHFMGYDEESQRIILFGDHFDYDNDVWIYNVLTDAWVQAASVARPSARGHGGFVYDSVSDRFVLFGGQQTGNVAAGDTWLYDTNTNTWTQMAPTGTPAARWGHAMAYDRQSDRTIMFGGYWYQEAITWAYDDVSNTWENRTLTMAGGCSPPAMHLQAMSYDSSVDRILMIGNTVGGGGLQTWSYDYESNCWTQRMGTQPSIRSEVPVMAYDSQSGLTILQSDDEVSTSGNDSQTWAYNYSANTWTRVSVTNPVSHHPAVVYIPFQDRIFYYGGRGSCPNPCSPNQTWQYTHDAESPPPDTQAPTTPDGLTATPVSSSQINLSWNTSTDNVGVTGYRIYRNNLAIATTAGITYQNTGLSENTPYTYAIGAYDAAGNGSPATAGVTATTPGTPDTLPPALSAGSPAGTLSAGTTQTTLSLTSSENAVCRYGIVANTSYSSLPNSFSSTGGTTHTVTRTGLTNGSSYTYYVRCRDTAGNANTSDYPLAFSVATVATRTFYVDINHANANDANAGTSEDAPWRTLQRAMQSSVTAGDTVYVKNGTYDAGSGTFNPANSGTPTAPIAYRAYPGHRPLVTKPGGDPAGGNRMVIGADGTGNYVIWDGFALGPWTNVLVQNVNGVILENLIIDKGPSTPTVCGQNSYNGVFVQLANDITIRNTIIRNVTFAGCSAWNAAGIELYDSHNVHIHNNEIYNANLGVSDKENGVSNILELNYIHDIAGPGVMVTGYVTSRCGSCPVQDLMIRNNIFLNVEMGTYLNINDPSVQRNIDFYNNVVYDARVGFTVYGPIPDLDVYNNIFTISGSGAYSHIGLNAVPSDWLSNYNTFRVLAGSIRFSVSGTYETLPEWQSRGFDLHSLVSDPLFTGSFPPTSSSAFQLQADSPARNAGRVGGVASGASVHMGAYATGNEIVGLGAMREGGAE